MGKKKKKLTSSSGKKTEKKEMPSSRGRMLGMRLLKPELLLIIAFILALSLRLLYINQILSTPIFHGLSVDTEKYDSFALQILKGTYNPKNSLYLNHYSLHYISGLNFSQPLSLQLKFYLMPGS